jgi:HTH-type transcriptional regulator/antitoxin HigA
MQPMMSFVKRTCSILLTRFKITVMEVQLPFKVIKDYKQYIEYCNILEQYTDLKNHTEAQEDVIELLTVLIEAYDRERYPEEDEEPIDPVSSLKFVMEQNRMKAADLARELNVSKSLVSDILHYRRGFSKEFIRRLGIRFSFRQELWNRPYKLKPASKNSNVSKASKASKTSGVSKTSKLSKAAKPSASTRTRRSSKSTVKK